jgi:hypothetical protein
LASDADGRFSIDDRHGVILLIAVKLSDQWSALEAQLPADWSEVQVRVRAEQASELGDVARILATLGGGRVGDTLAVTVVRRGGPNGPAAARRAFARLDDARLWCELAAHGEVATDAPVGGGETAPSLATTWDHALATLPSDWSDLLCEVTLTSSDHLDRAALLCAPINPTRDGDRVAFVFRSARRAGYGVSPAVARRCFERCADEGIDGAVSILRMLSETDNVGTQGTVWLVAGRSL